MAKFVYRMQNILELKQKMESQEKMAFAIANAKLLEEQNKLQELIIRKSEYEVQLKQASEGTIDLRRIQQIKSSIERMKVSIRDQMFAIRKAQKELDYLRRTNPILYAQAMRVQRMAEALEEDTSVEQVLKRADEAMYEEKMAFKKKYGSYR